ncbi:MAG: YkgJ family cysteine cluster protein [Acidobacteriota bacterium]
MSVNPNRLIQLAGRRKMDEADFADLTEALANRRTGFRFEDELLGLYAESRDESIFITESTAIPDCLTCGACCAYFHQILISIEDATPRSLAWEVTDTDEQTTHWLRRDLGEARCVALAGEVGKRVSCAIYELRPTACRAFEAGSDRCQALRRMFGFEPRLTEVEMARHRQILRDSHINELTDEIDWAGELEGETAQVNFLRELIDYNLTKLKQIAAELQRVENLLNDKGAAEAIKRCVHAVDLINSEIDLIEKSVRANLPEAIGGLDSINRGDIAGRLLIIGNDSQVLLETAVNQMAAIGESVFVALGMQAKFGKEKFELSE